MAGSLIKIDEEIVTSAVASISLVGIDSTYDVYMVRFNNVTPDTDAVNCYFRVTKSGTADTTANYNIAAKYLKSYTTFSNAFATNDTKFNFTEFGTGTSESTNGILYLFNFANASEYSFVTFEEQHIGSVQNHLGYQGGLVHTVASASDGVNFSTSSGNIASGTFTLYGLKK